MAKPKNSPEAAATKPAHEIRLGRIKATIWPNETKGVTWYTVRLRRVYKADDGWKETDSFGRDDLPLVEKVAGKAHDWIFASAKDTPSN